MTRRCLVGFLVGALATALPGVAGATSGADALQDLDLIGTGQPLHLVIVAVGTLLAMALGGGGAAALMGCFERD
jgi:hypothetical protein